MCAARLQRSAPPAGHTNLPTRQINQLVEVADSGVGLCFCLQTRERPTQRLRAQNTSPTRRGSSACAAAAGLLPLASAALASGRRMSSPPRANPLWSATTTAARWRSPTRGGSPTRILERDGLSPLRRHILDSGKQPFKIALEAGRATVCSEFRQGFQGRGAERYETGEVYVGEVCLPPRAEKKHTGSARAHM